ncbi:GOLPH3/VPS74 family protein [Catellatospora tritici]|uniref:GOLPH3/VPS74 family protein n=1 Tax=Catellatospora tritici TaxID=2851566 RepID=UPI001C2D444C|nr:GPP34 family phosphoprotein [Catellatospora tritici]MBV1850815.1 GPP34 family phosphoprotein [Catellatospora tritici]MBV1851068.1 GPP34 family phosphoprotein [Catellatospora tritici]
MELSLAEQLVLLSYDDVSGRPLLNTAQLDCGVEGAILLTLSYAGKLVLNHGHLEVSDPTPTGDPVLDASLARIATETTRYHTPDWWIYHLASPRHREALLERLVERGIMVREDHAVLGVFHRRRYPERDTVVEKELITHLRQVVNRMAAPDRQSVSLLALAHTLLLDRHLFPEINRDNLRHRIAELTEGEWCGPAVAKVVYAMNMAVMAAITGGAASSPTAAVSAS